jgi:hypothetical protein
MALRATSSVRLDRSKQRGEFSLLFETMMTLTRVEEFWWDSTRVAASNASDTYQKSSLIGEVD